MVIEKAKRLVEHKRDVVILLDSLTRFARAHNAVIPSSGKVLSGGLDANALQRPRRFFATARNIEQSGTRKEELLLEKDELQKVWLLRKALSQLNPVEAMELLLDKLKLTKTNKEFLASMHSLG